MARFQTTLEDLPRILVRDMKARARRIDSALTKTAARGPSIVRPRVPVAFGVLKDSLHADGHRIVADGPAAAPVETGSRPHYPPLAPLIAWVKLRGMQSLHGGAKGPTGQGHADMVGLALQGEVTKVGGFKRKGSFTDVDAPVRIARALQLSIGRNGTKPYFYMGGSLPEIVQALDGFVRAALPDAAGSVSAPTSAGASAGYGAGSAVGGAGVND